MNLRPAKCDEMASLRCINLKLPMSESGIRPYVGFDRVRTLRPYKPAHSAEIPCGTFVCSLASHAAALPRRKGGPPPSSRIATALATKLAPLKISTPERELCRLSAAAGISVSFSLIATTQSVPRLAPAPKVAVLRGHRLDRLG